MKAKQRYAGDTLRRVQQVLDLHANQVGAVNSSDARKQLDAAVAQLDATVAEQGTRTRDVRGETANVQALSRELRVVHVGPISKYAKSNLTGVPNFTALTPDVHNLSGTRLVEAARAMVGAAEPFAAKFEAAAFPADFLAQLTAAADAVAASVSVRSQKRIVRSGATKQVATALKSGRQAVKSLEALVTRFTDKDPRFAEEWRVATRIVARPGVVNSTNPAAIPAVLTATPTTVPAPVPTPAPVSVAATVPAHAAGEVIKAA
jgi:hypothetical protein